MIDRGPVLGALVGEQPRALAKEAGNVNEANVPFDVPHGLAHGFNIKVAKSGVMESAAILALARKHGLKLMVGCMTETMIGLSAAINLAAGTDAFDYIDLDSVFFLYHKKRFGNLSLQGDCFVIQP